MTEEGTNIDNLPFDARAGLFKTIVQSLGIGVGGNEEYDIRAFGRQLINFHSAESEEDREEIRGQADALLEKLRESGRAEVTSAVAQVILAEGMLGEIGKTE